MKRESNYNPEAVEERYVDRKTVARYTSLDCMIFVIALQLD